MSYYPKYIKNSYKANSNNNKNKTRNNSTSIHYKISQVVTEGNYFDTLYSKH